MTRLRLVSTAAILAFLAVPAAYTFGQDKAEKAAGGDKSTIECDVMLVSIGRIPYTANLGLAEIGVAMDKRGRVVTDNQQKSGWFSRSYELLFSDGTHVVFNEVAESE